MQKGGDETIVALMTRRTGECDLGAGRLHVLHDGDGLWRLLGCTHRRVLQHLQAPARSGALSRCHRGLDDTLVGPGQTPTVHRCPYAGRL